MLYTDLRDPEIRQKFQALNRAIVAAETTQKSKNRIKVSQKEERTCDGITFASKAEMNRYKELKMLEMAGKIRELQCQPSFVIQEVFIHKTFGKIQKISYKADFSYFDVELGHTVVEDVKGYKTEIYRLKKKLFLAKYPEVDFREVGVGRQRKQRNQLIGGGTSHGGS
jgi:hypothetical protein